MASFSFLDDKTEIRRVRVASTVSDAQNRLQRIIAGTDLSSSLTPAGGILIVKSLADPLPGTLRPSIFSFQPPPAWSNALEDSLEAVFKQAARPGTGTCSGSAPAVFFATEAELLSCLALAAVRGRLFTEWWWRTLLGRDIQRPWTYFWRAAPELVPAAVDLLERSRQLQPVVQAISVPETQILVTAVDEVFGVTASSVQDSLFKPRNRSPAPLEQDETSLAIRGHSQPTLESSLPLGKPLEPVLATAGQDDNLARDPPHAIAEILASLTKLAGEREKVRFFALALTLSRDSVFARRREFWDWIEQHLLSEQPAIYPGDALKKSQVRSHSVREAETRPDEGARDRVEADHLPPHQTQGDIAAPPGLVEKAFPSFVEAINGFETKIAPESNRVEGTFESSCLRKEALALGGDSTSVCHTEFGGIFYLANITISLGLYGDFTQPLHPGIDVSPWDLFFLIGTRALGEEFVADPVASFLGELAGRAREKPMPQYEVPRHWQPSDEFVRRELEKHHVATARPPGKSFAAWIDWVFDIIAIRVQCAFEGGEKITVTELLRQRARSEATATHLRVFYSLATHPLAIRLAGLDRDPGWVPAGGRTILFHYG
jgi:hypothetical protein